MEKVENVEPQDVETEMNAVGLVSYKLAAVIKFYFV